MHEKTLPESIKSELNKVVFKVVPLGFVHFAAYSLGYKKKIPFAFALWLIPGIPAAFMGGAPITLACLLNAWWEFTSDPENCNLDELRRKYDPGYVPINIFDASDEPEALPSGSEPQEEDPEDSEAISCSPSPQTALHALPVAATRPTRDDDEGTGQMDWGQGQESPQKPSEKSELGPLKQFASTPKHLYVVSLSGGGKGVWLSNYIRWRKEYEPDLLAFWIDPKCDRKEDGYFNEPWIKSYRFKGATMEVQDMISELKAAFRSYVDFVAALAEGTPVVLVVDECLLVQHLLDEHGANKSEKGTLRSQITLAMSVGDSDNKHIVCVSQSPNAGDSGVSGGVLRGLRKVILFRSDEFDVMHQAKVCGAIAENIPSDADLRRLCRHSPRGRAVYLNGKYHPMPELTNYSGYDRDKRKWTDQSKKPANRVKKQLSDLAVQTQAKHAVYETEEPSGVSRSSVELPDSIPENIAIQIADYLVAVLRQNKGSLPMSQAAIASSDTKLKKVKAKLGAEGWIHFLKYWNSEGKILLEESPKGIKLNLPDDSCEESWDDIISS